MVAGGTPEAGAGRRIRLQLDEDGTIRLAVNNLADEVRGVRRLDWHFAISTTVYVIGLFEQIRQEAGIQSALDIGVHLEHLAGVVPRPLRGNEFPYAGSGYGADSYRRTTRLALPEMDGDLTAGMERLWGPLLRPLGLGDRLRPERAS